MKPEVAQSIGVFECVVTDEMTARLDGRLIHPVYSTFWLAYHAEVAARRAIEPFFDENENAVGGDIALRHEAMCAVGETIRVEAKVIEVTSRKVVCSIEAFASTGRIASGLQTQVLLNQELIDKLVREAQVIKKPD